MKKLKFLPLALALLLAVPVSYAADSESNTAHCDFDLTVQPYLNIVASPTESSATSTEISGDYSLLTLTGAPSTKFTVINNTNNQKLYLVAKTTVNDGTADALNVTVDGEGKGSYRIAFANQDASACVAHKPTLAGVADALAASPVSDNNPNVIAFDLGVNVATSHGGALTTTAFKGGKQAEYTLTSGKYEITCTVGSESKTNTFSPQDEHGQYLTILTLQDSTF